MSKAEKISAKKSELIGVFEAVAGKSSTLIIIARDSRDTLLISGGANITIVTQFQVKLNDNNDGSYNITFTENQSENYSMTIYIDG